MKVYQDEDMKLSTFDFTQENLIEVDLYEIENLIPEDNKLERI